MSNQKNIELLEAENLALRQEILKLKLKNESLEKQTEIFNLPNANDDKYLVLFDSDQTFLYISKVDYGFEMQNLLGKKVAEVMSKADADEFDKYFNEAKQFGKSRIYVHTIQTPIGAITQRNQIRQIDFGKTKQYLVIAENINENYETLKINRENEDSVALALDYTKTGTWRFSKTTMLFVISKELQKILQHFNDFLSIPEFVEIVHIDDRERATLLISNVLSGLSDETDLNVRVIINGELKYLEIKFQGVFNGGKEIIEYYGITQDVSDKVKKIETEENYNSLIQSINTNLKAGLYRSSPENGLLFCNKAMWEMFGYNSFEELKQVPVLDLYMNKEDRDFTKADIAGKFEKSDIYASDEVEFIRKDGSTFWALVNSVTKKDDDGNFYFDGAVHDITAMKIAEEKFLKQFELLQTIFDSVPLMLSVIEPETKSIWVNKTWEKAFGWKMNEVDSDFIFEKLFKNKEFKNQILKDNFKDLELVAFDKTGNEIPILTTNLSMTDGRILTIYEDLREKNIIKKELKKQEVLFSNLIKNSSDVYSIFDKDGRGVYHSDRFYELMGYTKEELLHSGFWNHVHQDDLESIRLLFQTLVANKSSVVEFLVRLNTKNGNIIYYEGIAKNMLDDKNINGVVVNGRDATERIINQGLLQDQKNRYQAILNATESSYSLFDKKGIIIAYNYKMYEDTLKFSNIKLENKVTNFRDFIYPDRLSSFINNFEKALNGETIRVVNDVVGPSNIKSWFAYMYKPAYDENNKIYGVAWSIQNVTTIKENEVLIQKSLSEFKALFNAIPDTIIRLDKECNILEIKEGVNLNNILLNNNIGKNISSIGLPKYVSDELIKATTNSINTNRIELIEFQLSDEFGDSNYFETRIVANADSSVLAIIRDITDRKKFEYRMKALNSELELKIQERTSKLGEAIVNLSSEIDNRITAQKEAENAKELLQISLEKEIELNEIKTRFVAMVSHEYRTPLTIIQTSTFLLEKYFANHNEHRFYTNLDKVHKSVASMVDMLENVLSFSKLESGNIQRKLSSVNINELCQNIFNQYKSFDDKIKHSLILELNIKELTITTDLNLLYQILSNLVFNAIKYSPNGGEVKLIVIQENNNIIFSVVDHGIGIAKEDIAKLSEPFHRGGNVENIAGTGLGLSIVKAWTKILEGKMKIQSELGKGSNFTITLPKSYK